jgi:asparagine synthase (glutamine-hydrolysing)
MNLFIFGWNLPKEQHSKALAELRQMHGVYPQLDIGTFWSYSSPCGAVFLASMHTADHAAAPRRYVVRGANEIVLYAGLPVSISGAFEAHRAEALAAHWGELTEDLDGQYVVLRATAEPACVELQTDILGMEQVYCHGQRETWLVSNSVRLIERISGPKVLDPLGVSLFLSIGWTGADRTLRRDVRVIPGGQRWVWGKGDNTPSEQSYFGLSKLASQRRQRLTAGYVERLAEDLMALCRSRSQSFGTISCPLTAGRVSYIWCAVERRCEDCFPDRPGVWSGSQNQPH